MSLNLTWLKPKIQVACTYLPAFSFKFLILFFQPQPSSAPFEVPRIAVSNDPPLPSSHSLMRVSSPRSTLDYY